MNEGIDLHFRPATYFAPASADERVLSDVKGSVLRTALRGILSRGRSSEARRRLGLISPSGPRERSVERQLGAVHPMYMGGNYLPDADSSEVEVARITIRSTTYDTTCVYARLEGGTIHYRVVDEYGGDTLKEPNATTTVAPMTLGEFADFFLKAWRLANVVEYNYEGDLDGALGFFWAESAFYPQLDHLCRQRVREHYAQNLASS